MYMLSNGNLLNTSIRLVPNLRSDSLRSHILALRALKQHPSEWRPLLIHVICTKLDAVTIRD